MCNGYPRTVLVIIIRKLLKKQFFQRNSSIPIEMTMHLTKRALRCPWLTWQIYLKSAHCKQITYSTLWALSVMLFCLFAWPVLSHALTPASSVADTVIVKSKFKPLHPLGTLWEISLTLRKFSRFCNLTQSSQNEIDYFQGHSFLCVAYILKVDSKRIGEYSHYTVILDLWPP